MNDYLFNAILSMDSYNRGYGRSINLETIPNTSKLGNATITLDSRIFRENGNELDQSIGFYALAYDYNGETVIAFRGTNVDGAFPEEDDRITYNNSCCFVDILCLLFTLKFNFTDGGSNEKINHSDYRFIGYSGWGVCNGGNP